MQIYVNTKLSYDCVFKETQVHCTVSQYMFIVLIVIVRNSRSAPPPLSLPCNNPFPCSQLQLQYCFTFTSTYIVLFQCCPPTPPPRHIPIQVQGPYELLPSASPFYNKSNKHENPDYTFCIIICIFSTSTFMILFTSPRRWHSGLEHLPCKWKVGCLNSSHSRKNRQ